MIFIKCDTFVLDASQTLLGKYISTYAAFMLLITSCIERAVQLYLCCQKVCYYQHRHSRRWYSKKRDSWKLNLTVLKFSKKTLSVVIIIRHVWIKSFKDLSYHEYIMRWMKLLEETFWLFNSKSSNHLSKIQQPAAKSKCWKTFRNSVFPKSYKIKNF